MEFCHWYALDSWSAHAPKQPGVFQVKLPRGLLSYPKGKSAMLHYAASDDLSRAIADFASAHAGEPWLCRHFATDDSSRLLEQLASQFERRFGEKPRLPG